MANTYPIVNNEQQQQFQIVIGDEMALLEYRLRDNMIFLMHTEVPESMEGKGIGSALASHALEYARSNNMKAKVYCAFVKKYLERHREYDDVVVKT
jgi:uncharacterized protein